MLDDKDRVFRNLYGQGDWGLAGARARGAWDGTKGFIEKGRDWLVNEVKASGQRGRGGAGFATGLKWAFQTKNDMLIFPASGTGGLESAVANLVSPGERIIVVTIGAFGDRCDIRWNVDQNPMEEVSARQKRGGLGGRQACADRSFWLDGKRRGETGPDCPNRFAGCRQIHIRSNARGGVALSVCRGQPGG